MRSAAEKPQKKHKKRSSGEKDIEGEEERGREFLN